jgi:TolA-binding protein
MRDKCMFAVRRWLLHLASSLLFCILILACDGAEPSVTNSVPIERKPDRLENVQIDLANGFYLREFYDLALKEYQKYMEWFPKGEFIQEAKYRIADCQKAQAKLPEAREGYENLIKEFPKGLFVARAHFRLGELDWDENRLDTALKHFVQANTQAESDATRLTARFYQARTLLQLNQTKDAVPVLRDLARVENENPYRGFAFLELARSLESQGDDAEALVFYGSVLKTDCSPLLKAEAGIKAGLMEMKAKHWSSAATYFEKVRTLQAPAEWINQANLYSVRAYYNADQFASALTLLANSRTVFPKGSEAEIKLIQAHALRMLKRYKEAVASYDQFLKQFPNHSEIEQVRYQRLISLQALDVKNWNEEAQAFLKKFPTSSKNPQIQFYLIERAYQKKDFVETLRLVSGLQIEKLPASLIPEVLLRRAVSNFELRDYKSASKNFGDFILKYPKHEFASYALLKKGTAEQNGGDLQDALFSFKNFLQNFSKSQERESILYRVGLINGELKRYEELQNSFQQLIKEFPSGSLARDAKYWIGWSLFEQKKFSDALPYLIEVRKLNSEQYGTEATSRIILSRYYLEQRSELIKELNILKASTPVQIPVEVYRWLAQASLKDKDFYHAERYFRKLVELPSAKAFQEDSLRGLGESLSAQVNWKAAAEIWAQLLKEFPQSHRLTETKLLLAQASRHLKDFDQSQKIAEEVMQLEPEGKNNALARFTIAESFEDQKKYSEAGKYFLSVAVLYDDPDLTPLALKKAIRNFEFAGDEKEADRLKEELKKKYPSN